MIKRLLRDHLPLTAAVLSMLRDMVASFLAADRKRLAQRAAKTKRGARKTGRNTARPRPRHH